MTKHDYQVTHNDDGTFSVALPDGEELRIVPPKREWVGLTDEEIKTLAQLEGANRERTATEMAFAVQAKLKEKNT